MIHKAILIDPCTKTIATVDSNGSLEHWYQLIQTEYIESTILAPNEIMMFAEVPESGAGIFRMRGHEFRGRALIVGADERGVARDTSIDVEQLRQLIDFRS